MLDILSVVSDFLMDGLSVQSAVSVIVNSAGSLAPLTPAFFVFWKAEEWDGTISKRPEEKIDWGILDVLSAEKIQESAQHLGHHNTLGIIGWGADVEKILGDFVSGSVRTARAEDMDAGAKSENALKNFADMVSLRDIGMIRKAFIKARMLWMETSPAPMQDQYNNLYAKIAPWDKRMDICLQSMDTLARQYGEDIDAARDRVERYAQINQKLEKIDTVLRLYRDALQERRGSIIRDEARALHQGRTQDDSLLSARVFGGQRKDGIRADIDSRLESLARSLQIAEAAYLTFAQMQERQKSIIQYMGFFKDRQLPVFRHQLLQAVDIRMGRAEAFNAAAGGKADLIVFAQGMLDLVESSVKSERVILAREKEDFQKEVQKAETFLIADMRPLALLENGQKKYGALPAPHHISSLDQD